MTVHTQWIVASLSGALIVVSTKIVPVLLRCSSSGLGSSTAPPALVSRSSASRRCGSANSMSGPLPPKRSVRSVSPLLPLLERRMSARTESSSVESVRK